MWIIAKDHEDVSAPLNDHEIQQVYRANIKFSFSQCKIEYAERERGGRSIEWTDD